MPLAMKEKKAVIEQLAFEYKRTPQKKVRILDTLINITGLQPVLRRQGAARAGQAQGSRQRTWRAPCGRSTSRASLICLHSQSICPAHQHFKHLP